MKNALEAEPLPLDSASSTTSPSEYEPPEPQPEKKTCLHGGKTDVTTSAVVEALDRCQMSSQQAMMVISPCLAAVGVASENVTLSRSTINRRRSEHRISIDKNIRDTFESGDTLLTVHFDGKKMKDNTERAAGRKMDVERLAIVVSSIRGCKLLAIPKIANGAGQTIADYVYGKWNLIPDIRALCFDTTSSNTDKFTGIATILDTVLPNPVLFCACRHHIAELLLGKAFELTVEPITSAPTIGIFQRFQNATHEC